MKLLVDNQLPLALAAHMRGWGLDCIHVLECGLASADDAQIWAAAGEEGRLVVSKMRILCTWRTGRGILGG